ncbi:phospholipase domain-containing protein [Mucilaginibacter antarcticus]|uniref:phospholipase domain-containing protein n=1 Tax=Mucilaginibacter antarcticus TaxID=1855725 RepID=UPI00363ADD0B
MQITFKAGAGVGAPFNVYAPILNGGQTEIKAWNFAVKPNDELNYPFKLISFKDGAYNLMAYGPNGFLRTFAGDKNDAPVTIDVAYLPQGDIELRFKNTGDLKHEIIITDNSYKTNNHQLSIAAGALSVQKLNLQKSHFWYDFAITLKGKENFSRGYAGRVETGKHGFTDPLIGA